MNSAIQFQKFVDIIDEGIMQLSLYKEKKQFPDDLKGELLDILNFLSKTKDNQLETVLHDKKVSIDAKDLNTIKERMHEISIEEINIQDIVTQVDKLGAIELSASEINSLEVAMLNLSIPLWHTVILEKSYE